MSWNEGHFNFLAFWVDLLRHSGPDMLEAAVSLEGMAGAVVSFEQWDGATQNHTCFNQQE